jgi:cytochrome d ubiquinol oxidase subunit II
MELTTVWFILVAVLWTGFFFLEGFDVGVGILLPFAGRDALDRRVLIATVGPHWDGNEVWLITAGGAMFAAFPEWYATLFSGFYLALLLLLGALIVRGVAFEFRNKHDDPRWQQWWDRGIFAGSVLPAFLFGVAFGGILHGVPIGPDHEYAGSFLDLLHPYALFTGVTTLVLFTLHGASSPR